MIIGVALDREAQVVMDFAASNHINMGHEDVSTSYGDITALPTTFVIDWEGRISKKYVGYQEKEVFERDITHLLARRPSLLVAQHIKDAKTLAVGSAISHGRGEGIW